MRLGRKLLPLALMFCVIFLVIAVTPVGVLAGSAPEIEWSRTFGGSGYDLGRSVEQTKDGGYIVAGYFGGSDNKEGGDVYLVKVDSDGNTEWSARAPACNVNLGIDRLSSADVLS